MLARSGIVVSSLVIAFCLFMSSLTARADDRDGVVRVKSSYSQTETISRLKKAVASKGIMFFSEINQSQLAAKAGIKIQPSTLLVFGNPPLGTTFLSSSPASGLDWPVRLLVHQDASGNVWAVYTDFQWIARRHRIEDRTKEFEMASQVIAAITSSVQAK
jgi:uncharacterized protein (DUF302 family)